MIEDLRETGLRELPTPCLVRLVLYTEDGLTKVFVPPPTPIATRTLLCGTCSYPSCLSVSNNFLVLLLTMSLPFTMALVGMLPSLLMVRNIGSDAYEQLC